MLGIILVLMLAVKKIMKITESQFIKHQSSDSHSADYGNKSILDNFSTYFCKWSH